MDELDAEVAVVRDRLHEDLGKGTMLEVVLRGHLWVEAELIGGISELLPFPDEIDLARLSFPTKVSLAAAHGLMPPSEKRAYLKLNALRNKIAHDLEAEVTQDDLLVLVSAFSPTQRKIYESLPRPSTSVGWKWNFRASVLMLRQLLVSERTFMSTKESDVGRLVTRIARLASQSTPAPPVAAADPGSRES